MLNDINTITIILAVALGIFLLLLIILAAVYFSSKSKERKELVSFVRLTNVDESQHHHNEGLKQHDKNME